MAKPFEKELIASTHHLPTPEGLQSGLPTAGRSGKKRSKMDKAKNEMCLYAIIQGDFVRIYKDLLEISSRQLEMRDK